MKSNGFVPHFVPDFFKIKGGPMRTGLARLEMDIRFMTNLFSRCQTARSRRRCAKCGRGAT
jgi:hypothetical protein